MFGGPSHLPVISNSKINAPPSLDSTKFPSWLRGYEFRRDLYWCVSDSQLLSITGLTANPNLRAYTIRFVRETRQDHRLRSLKNFLGSLESQFSANNRERQAHYLDEVLNIRREPSGTIQSFWFKFDELEFRLEGSSVDLPDSAMFLRLLKSLNINSAMRLSIIPTLNCRGLAHSISPLRTAAIDLFGVYKVVLGKPENALRSEEWGGDTGSTSSASIYSANAKVKKRRPGMETNAIRNSLATAGLPNSSVMNSHDALTSENQTRIVICRRCGKDGHLLKQCHMPYTRQLAFAPKRSFGEMGNNTLLSEDEAIDLMQQESSLNEVLTSDLITDECAALDVPENLVKDEPIANELYLADCQRIQHWAEEKTYIAFDGNTTDYNVCSRVLPTNDVSPSCLSLDSLFISERINPKSAFANSPHPHLDSNVLNDLAPLILDSGATSAVAGCAWVRRWVELSKVSPKPQLRPSSKTFKFGDSRKFKSLGRVTLHGVSCIKNRWYY